MTIKVPLFENGICIGRVTYTDNLDSWTGNNMVKRSIGRHAGVGKTRCGKFYRVDGTQWQGERDTAEVISEAEAKQAVMRANKGILYKDLFGEEIPDLD